MGRRGLASGPSKSFLSGSTANDLPFRGCLWASAKVACFEFFAPCRVLQPLSPFLLAPLFLRFALHSRWHPSSSS
jgi:hypothetical protein